MNRLAIKRRIGHLFRLLAQPRHRRIVLLYHAVGDGAWALPVAAFVRQIEHISNHSRPFRLSQFDLPAVDDRLEIAITFDDGYASLADIVRPVAKDHGLAPAVFLNTGWIGTGERKRSEAALGHYPDETFMSWPDVEALARDGWEIGSHGIEHLDLTVLERPAIDAELTRSKLMIEQRLSRPCPGFSFTWGRHNALVRQRVAAAGYTYACTGRHSAMALPPSAFEIPRLNIDGDYDFDDFLAIVRGDWDYLKWLQRLREAL